MNETPRTLSEVVVPPPREVKLSNYPIAFGMLIGIAATAVLMVLAGRFDPTQGVLTISLLVVLVFCSALIFAMRFSIPQDPETAALVGGLVSTFGAVVAYWLARKGD